jgi:2-deoxy-D-gluconate 3-dehydrogenase
MTLSLFSLDGKTALVTGGNGGLGRAIALGIRDAGAHVIATGRNPEKNSAMSSELGQTGAVVTLDVRDEKAVEKTMAQALDRFGHLYILVNNAGLFRGGSVLNLSKDDWEAVIGTHLTGSFLCSKHAARMMNIGNAGGKIINIGSMGKPRRLGRDSRFFVVCCFGFCNRNMYSGGWWLRYYRTECA